MESAGCQTETETSAGCEIWPSLDWSCDLGTGTAWADGCPHWHLIASSRALAVSGKIPDFSQRRMSERTRKTLNGLKNQLIKELIFQLLLSKGALSPLLNESCYKQAFFQYVVRGDTLCVPLVALKRHLHEVWGSMHGVHARIMAGCLQVCFKDVYQIKLNLSHSK